MILFLGIVIFLLVVCVFVCVMCIFVRISLSGLPFAGAFSNLKSFWKASLGFHNGVNSGKRQVKSGSIRLQTEWLKTAQETWRESERQS